MHKEHVYIGLGSNLGDSADTLGAAFGAINALENTRILSKSSLYSSSPMGPKDQPDYHNAVCLIETALEPHVWGERASLYIELQVSKPIQFLICHL